MIHLKDINKTYQGAQPLHVLKGISLDIAKGEFVSIMGASGSGKSTLLNILGILDNYDSGTYELAGVPIWNLSETKAAEYRNKMIGFIFQSFNLISFKTAVENVELETTRGNSQSAHHPSTDHLSRRAYGRTRLKDICGGDAVAQASQRRGGHDYRGGDP